MNRFEFLGFMGLSHGIPISVYSRRLAVAVFFGFWLHSAAFSVVLHANERVKFPAEDGGAGSFQPGFQNAGIDGAEIDVVFEIAVH